LYVNDGEVEIKDAERLWGKDAYEAEESLKKELGDKVRVACIGKGGENLVKFAGVMSDMGRTTGRSGIGCVVGSKNLKAVAVSGTKKMEAANPEKMSALVKGMIKINRAWVMEPPVTNYGTSVWLDLFNDFGDVPFKYWTLGGGSDLTNLGGLKMAEEILTGNYHCYGCPIGCGREVKVTSPAKYAVEGPGPEYETLTAFGSLCMIDDLAAIAKVNDICNRYGIDTIETGSLVAFSMYCYDKGWITREDTDGLDLIWGNADAAIALVEKIAKREGFGNTLADGLKPAAEKIGHDASKIIGHVKGQAFPMHDPRDMPGTAINYGTSERGHAIFTDRVYSPNMVWDL